jgi:(E)-4-hydroxy-3-methylbut-2-enyl-diphosphate synthase
MNKTLTRTIKVGNLQMGGDSPITIQSMTNTKTADWKGTINQIKSLELVGCEIIRIAVNDIEEAKLIGKIKKSIGIPLVADIHFDYKLALEAVNQGIDKIRINPGNIGSIKKVRAVVTACKERNIPIRIGVNVGSIEKKLLEKYGPTPKAAVKSCLGHVRILEDLDFTDIAISVKFSDVSEMIDAYRKLAVETNYPLHLGVTHAGTTFIGTIKNTLGIGALLLEGIGATIRVSLTAPPEQEIRVGWAILNSLGLRQRGPCFISCPTCGRKQMDVEAVANKVEAELGAIANPLKIAIMGCSVNGPGEAKQADIGIAGGKGSVSIFKKGEIWKSGGEKEMLGLFMEEIKNLDKEKA